MGGGLEGQEPGGGGRVERKVGSCQRSLDEESARDLLLKLWYFNCLIHWRLWLDIKVVFSL